MSWRKLVPRPRWLPRAAVMHPQRVVIWCFSFVLLLTLGVGLRDLYVLHQRVLTGLQHSLTLRAMALDAAMTAQRFRLLFVRDYAGELIRIEQSQAPALADPAIERAYAARNAPIWQMEVPPGDAPVVGVGPETLAGLPGFERRDADLRADLFTARNLGHVLGLALNADSTRGAVTYISSNGLYVTYPPLPIDKAPALLQRFASMSYFRDQLPDRNPHHDIRWAPPYTQFESTQLRTTVSVPIYVDDRFRGVVAVDLALTQVQAMLGADDAEQPGVIRYLMDREGRLVPGRKDLLLVAQRWAAVAGETWRDVTPEQLFEAGSAVREAGGNYLFSKRLAAGNFVVVDIVPRAALYRQVFDLISKPLLAVWIALPLLMWVSVRLVSVLFGYYLALGEKLQQLAERDPLTDLANRRHFGERFAQALGQREREHSPLAMLMVDIDHFKKVNDRWGHANGDRVLQRLATVLRENLRAVDVPARIGGEEFAVLLPGATLAEAAASAERLRATVAAITVEPAPDTPALATQGDAGARIRFTVSIGVAEAGSDGCQTLDAMLATADRRLYAAKAAGRDRVCAADAPAGNVLAPRVAG